MHQVAFGVLLSGLDFGGQKCTMEGTKVDMWGVFFALMSQKWDN